VYRESNAEISNRPVPIIPAVELKYFLPNIPSNKKPAKGSIGINAM
jgi:hypothetical protein